MENREATPMYRLWNQSGKASDPVELPGLIQWIKSGQANADSWIYLEHETAWRKAGALAECQMFLKPRAGAAAAPSAGPARPASDLKPAWLRRIKILADMSDEQLEVFVSSMETLRPRQFSQVVNKDEHGDAMYLILEGELRVRIMIDRKESTLATLSAGDFFGEISLLDHGPRSADVVANKDSVLVRISTAAFERLMRESPQVALPFLYALSKSVVGRVRNVNKRYEDSIHFSRTASTVH